MRISSLGRKLVLEQEVHMNEVQIQYQGFHPTPFTESFLDSSLQELCSQAPSGAIIQAVFRRKNKMLIASIRILSATGNFFTQAHGQRLGEVSRRLSERTRRQLRRWKTMRLRKRRDRQPEEDPHDTVMD